MPKRQISTAFAFLAKRTIFREIFSGARSLAGRSEIYRRRMRETGGLARIRNFTGDNDDVERFVVPEGICRWRSCIRCDRK